MKATELMKEVKGLSVSEFRKFKKMLDKYCIETVKDIIGTPYVVPTTPVIPSAETKVEAKIEPVEKIVPVYKDSNKGQWNQFFKSVRESGVEHGKPAPEDSNVLALATKKSDKCVAAALVNHRGTATNVIYSPVYEYPLVFAKVTMDELRKIRKDIMDKFPADADIKKIGKNTTENGKASNFFYDEIEDGNFCCRFKRKDGNIVYFGYIVDEDICFYRNPDGSIPMINMKYFFMPNWGTKESKVYHELKTEAAVALINRAFNDDCKTIVEEQPKAEAEEQNDNNQEDILSDEEEKARKAEEYKRQQERNEERRQEKIEKQLQEEAEKQKQIEENGESVKELPGGKKEITKADGTIIRYNKNGVKERETAPDGTTTLYKPDGSVKRIVLPRKESERQFRG